MALDVTVSTEIARPRDVVAAYASDPDHDPIWYTKVKEVEWKTDRPMRVGTQVSRVSRSLGRRMAYTYEVLAWIPGEHLHMRSSDGPFPMNTEYTWEDAGDGRTRMQLRNHGGPVSWLAIGAASLMARQIRQETTRDLALLKRTLEQM